MSKLNATRGFGLLERFLATQRSKIANRLIPSTHRKGSILDIGCGAFPLFLPNTTFSKKYGLDKIIQENYDKKFQEQEITFINYDIEREKKIPFDSYYFDVVTMLAVIEHIQPKRTVKILREIHRILKTSGICIITTPTVHTGFLLKLMAKLRLVSPVEIEEHKCAYNSSRIISILQETNFSRDKLQVGYFEMFMNIWATAIK